MNSQQLARKLLDAFSGRSTVDAQLIRFCKMISEGQQAEIYSAMRSEKMLSETQKKEIISAINAVHFIPQQLEWTNHGVLKTFRFWTADEKAEYLRTSVEIIAALREITPHVCFGFGSVLGMVRDNDFISHDDDMDILIAFPATTGSTFNQKKQEIRELLEQTGFKVHGANLSHYGVNRGSGTATDIFIGFTEENSSVSWYPSRRYLHRLEDIFPTVDFRMYGVECPIPNEPVRYLEKTYGLGWNFPIANWNHPWDSSEYKSFIDDTK